MWLSHREVIEFSSLKRISNNWITSWVNKCHQHVFLFYSMIVCMFVAVCVKTVAIGRWDFPPCHCQLTISHCLQLSWFSLRTRGLCVKCLPRPSGLLTAALREKYDVSRGFKCKDGMVWHVISNTRLSSWHKQWEPVFQKWRYQIHLENALYSFC